MIDTRLLNAYVAELEALRDHGRDLANIYPDIASRLDIGGHRSRDPHVERVVQSAAFLAARLRLMIDSTATEIPLTALSVLAPVLADPVPSMALLKFQSGTEQQEIPRGSRFDYQVGGQVLACFSTTMSVIIAPLSLKIRRLQPSRAYPDGLAIRLLGIPPKTVTLCLGNDELTAATLMDGFDELLSGVEVIQPGGSAPINIPRSYLRIHGFARNEAALPARPAIHRAHRIVTEFMVFPEKFRFVSLTGLPLRANSEVRFRFSRPLHLPSMLPPDLITVNRVPSVNLWRSAATPIDIDGRQIEYPVRVDALRYRTAECHTVEKVDMHDAKSDKPIRLDPVVALGEVQGTDIRWGIRRSVSRMGSEVLMYFQGLDYRVLGRRHMLITPSVLASNRDLAHRTPSGAELYPVESLGDWQCALVTTPTVYRPAITGLRAIETLVGYLQSSMNGLIAESQRGLLRDYLKRFPGGTEVGWIDGISSVSLHPVASLKGGHTQSGLAIAITFDSERYRTTSQAMVKRVIGELFESQRGINRVEEVIVRST